MLVAVAATCALAFASRPASADGHVRTGMALGASVYVAPKYEGSDEYRVIGIPMFQPPKGSGIGSIFKRYVSFEGLDDIRFKAIRHSGFEAGPLLGYSFGRDEDDGDRLGGLGDVDGGVIAGAFVRYRWSMFFVDTSYHHQLSGDVDGYQLRFSGGFDTGVAAAMRLYGKAGVTYADDSYMGSYFGVSAQQSARSTAGLAGFNAGSGIKDVFAEMGMRVALRDGWALHPKIRYSHLLNDAADSPVIETEHQFSGRLGFTYRWAQ